MELKKVSLPEITILSSDGAAVEAILQTQRLFYRQSKSIYPTVYDLER